MIESIDISETEVSEKKSLNQMPNLTLPYASFIRSIINIIQPQRPNNSSQRKNSIRSDNDNTIKTENILSLNTSISSSTVNIYHQVNSTNTSLNNDNNRSSENLSSNQKEIDINSISSFLDEK